MPRAKKPAAETSEQWAEYPYEDYAQICARLVTFSNKTVNSNAVPGGIRLGPEQALKLPYVSARTLLGAGVVLALDYMKDASKSSLVKQLNMIAKGVAPIAADEAKRIVDVFSETTSQGAQFGTDKICPRLRQLLLPRQDDYVTVTPLSAGGVSREIYTAVRAHNDRLHDAPNDQQQRIRLAFFRLGGAKSINVGLLADDMQHPLVCFAPTESPPLKAALSMHFKGLTVFLPYSLMRKFRDWCVSCRQRNGGLISTNMLTRDAEIDHIHAIARAVLAQAQQVRAQAQAEPVLQALCEELGMTSNLALRDGTSVVYVARVTPSGAFQGAVRVGSRLPAHATVLGRALLHDMDGAQLRSVFGGEELPQFSESTPRNVDELLRLLAEDRERGYAMGEGFYEPGVSSIAAPVRAADGRVVAGLAMAIPFTELGPEKTQLWVQKVLEAAETLSAHLRQQHPDHLR